MSLLPRKSRLGYLATVTATNSFESFYAATSNRVFRAACRMTRGDHALARDSIQEAYVVMWQRWPDRQSFAMEDNCRYVIGITAKKIIDRYRDGDNGCVELHDEFDDPAAETVYREVLDEMTVLNAVRNLLAGQPHRRRVVGLLFFLEGWKSCEIAVELEISESTVRTHIQRLRSLLKPFIHEINELEAR